MLRLIRSMGPIVKRGVQNTPSNLSLEPSLQAALLKPSPAEQANGNFSKPRQVFASNVKEKLHGTGPFKRDNDGHEV